MKFSWRRSTSSGLLFLFLLSALIPFFPALSQPPPYGEHLVIYDFKGSVFWQLNFTGGSVGLPYGITPPPGVNSFTIVDIQYKSWQPEYYIFGKAGFDLLNGLQSPANGVTLRVNATSVQAANAFATSLSFGFHLNLILVSTSGSNFTYYSNLDVSSSLFPRFWKITSTIPKGLINLTSQSSVASAPFSMVSFSGTLISGTTYSNAVAIGALYPTTSNQFNMTTVFPTARNVTASQAALQGSSSIEVRVFGGVFTQTQGGTVCSTCNDNSALQAHLVNSSLMPGKRIPLVNATLDTTFASVVVTRDIDNGNPTVGHPVVLTLKVTNIGTATAYGISFNDTWWVSSNNYFTLAPASKGKTFVSISSLAPGKSVSQFYSLTTGGVAASVPALPYGVQYLTPVAKVNITRTAYINQFTVFPNSPSTPVIVVLANANFSAVGVGQNAIISLDVGNRGNSSATGLLVAGQPQISFPGGGVGAHADDIVNASIFSGSLTDPTKRINFTVSWSAPTSGMVNSSSINLDYGFANAAVPSLSIAKTVVKKIQGSTIQANVSLAVTNTGSARQSAINLTDSFSSNLVFVANKGNFSAGTTPQQVVAKISFLNASQTKTLWYLLNVTKTSENYIFLPATYSASPFTGQPVTGNSTAASLALGITVFWSLSYTVGFVTQNTTETISVQNLGTGSAYGVNATSVSIPFLKVASGYSPLIAQSVNQSNVVTKPFTSTFALNGKFNSSAAGVTFQFGGVDNSASSNFLSVVVWRLPYISIAPSTSLPIEGHTFTLTMTLTNPANLTISNIKIVSHMPKYLSYISGSTFNEGSPTLGGNGTLTYKMNVKSNSPFQLNMTAPTVTFQYVNQTLHGTSTFTVLNIGDDIPIRYGIPMVLAIAMILVAVVMVRRILSKTAPQTKTR